MSRKLSLIGITVAALMTTACSPHEDLAPPVSSDPSAMPVELQGERYIRSPDGEMMTAAAMIAAGLVVSEVAGEMTEYYFDKKRNKYSTVPAHYHSRYWKRNRDKDGRHVYTIIPVYRTQIINNVHQYNRHVAKTYTKSGTVRGVFGSSARASAAS